MMPHPVRFSHLKAMALSPAHYLTALSAIHEPTDAMLLGSAVDALVFGVGKVVTYTGARRAGDEWKDFQRENEGAIILRMNDAARASSIANAVLLNKHAMQYLSSATAVQKQISWTWCDRAMQSTPDAVGPGWVVDLKTTRCAAPDRFQRDALARHYHCQLAMYAAATGQVDELAIIAVETSPPFPVVVYRLSDRAKLLGERTWQGWFERLRVCEDSNVWPGYSDAPVEFDVPDYGEIDFSDDEKEEGEERQ